MLEDARGSTLEAELTTFIMSTTNWGPGSEMESCKGSVSQGSASVTQGLELERFRHAGRGAASSAQGA